MCLMVGSPMSRGMAWSIAGHTQYGMAVPWPMALYLWW